jgi:hypothetical protein
LFSFLLSERFKCSSWLSNLDSVDIYYTLRNEKKLHCLIQG